MKPENQEPWTWKTNRILRGNQNRTVWCQTKNHWI